MEIHNIDPRRKILNHVMCNLLVEAGFSNCTEQALETLTEMLQSFLVELGQSARNFTELAGRTESLLADVILALVNMGFRLEGLEAYAKRQNKSILPSLQQQIQSKQFNILSAGVKQSHPAHIPNYLPPFPDPHAYIRTPTHKQPVTEYEAIREKAATQKRDIERALTRFMAKTSETHSLFLSEDNSAFPLIATMPQAPVYLPALLPRDQIFEAEAEFNFEQSPAKKRKEQKPPDDAKEINGTKLKTEPGEEIEEIATQRDIIDNPYLRPAKVPKNLTSTLLHTIVQ